MHCSNCKAKVNPGDKKCLNCGATLIWNNKKKQPLKTKNTKEKVKDKKEVIDKYVHEKMINERKERELKKIKERHTVFTKLILIFEFSLFLFSLFFLIIGLKVFLGVFLMGSFLFFLILTLISLFSKHLRPTFWLPIIFIFCIMSLTIFITVVNIPFANKALKETGAEEIFEEVLPAEEPVEEKVIEEPPKEEIVEEEVAGEEETSKEIDEEQSDTQKDFSNLTLDEKIEYIIVSLLGEETNNDLPKIVDIEIAPLTGEEGPEGNTAFIILNGNDNLTTNWIKESMWIDSIELFEEFFKLEEITRVDLKWQFPLVDTYGDTELVIVMEILLTRDIVEKINWDNFLFQNLLEVAQLYQEHPVFSND